MRVRKYSHRTKDLYIFFSLYGHGGHLDQVKWIFNTCIVHLPIDASDLALIGQTVSGEKRFIYYDNNTHVYCPRVGGGR